MENRLTQLTTKIDAFDSSNKKLLSNISNLDKEIEFNNTFRTSYEKLIVHLKKYRDSLPVLIAQDISAKTKEYYNIINQSDPDFEKIEELKLPSGPGEKIELCFKTSNSKLDALQVLSEGHIKCLGLSLLLAKAVKEKLNFLIFDDFVNAIDDNHKSGIIKLLMTHEDISKKQQLVTCHGEEFIKNLENELDQKIRNGLIGNLQFIAPDIMEQRGVMIRCSEPKHYIELAERNFINDNRRDTLTYCRKATENILDAFWKKMSNKTNFQLSISMRAPGAQPDLKSLLTAIIQKLNKMEMGESVEILPSFEKLASEKMWKMLNKGTHEQSKGIPEFEREDIKDLVNLLKHLELSVKSTRTINKIVPI